MGVGNPEGAKFCLVCDGDLTKTVASMEGGSFDLDVTKRFLIEYRKNFWGVHRTGAIVKYRWDEMEQVEFGSPVNRLIFIYGVDGWLSI